MFQPPSSKCHAWEGGMACGKGADREFGYGTDIVGDGGLFLTPKREKKGGGTARKKTEGDRAIWQT